MNLSRYTFVLALACVLTAGEAVKLDTGTGVLYGTVEIPAAKPPYPVVLIIAGSGPTDRDGRLFLQKPDGLPIFAAAADDDQYGPLTETMQWLISVSKNPESRFQRYATGRHGAEMFGPHKDLLDLIAQWFVATLTGHGALPATNGAAFDASIMHTLDRIDQPGGAAEVSSDLAQARKRDPHAILFSERIVNLLGYEHLQMGDTKNAVEILKLDSAAYPQSPNVYDSLGDAYLADGQRELALQNAKKALQLLATDTTDPETRKQQIRESAEQKVKQLEPSAPKK